MEQFLGSGNGYAFSLRGTDYGRLNVILGFSEMPIVVYLDNIRTSLDHQLECMAF